MVFKSFRDGEAFLKLAYLRECNVVFEPSPLVTFREMVQPFSTDHLWRW